MRSVLGVLVAATFAAGLAVVVDDARQDAARRNPVIDVVEGDVEVVPPSGQAEVSGRATRVVAGGATGPHLALPLRFEVPPGEGGATIEGAIVDGERVSIVWDGGRPLELSGEGAVAPGPVRIDAGPGAVTWSLDGAPRGFVAGSYAISTPVAVGAAGLATPRDGVRFTADDATALVTRGGVTVVLPPAPLRLEGPGTLHVEGALAVRTANGTVDAAVLDHGPGPYAVDLAPAPGGDGWTLEATVRGPLALDGA